MAVSFKVPKSPSRSIFEINDFLGVDFTNSGTDVDERRSPNAPNMVRLVPGKVRKRMGYELVHDFETTQPIYGTHILRLNEEDVDTVVNTNRALQTSSTYKPFTLTTNAEVIYTLGSPFYASQYIYYSFDYSLSSGIASIQIGNEWIELVADADGHMEGYVGYIPFSDTETVTNIKAKISERDTSSLTLLLQIKNFCIAYDMDNEYSYSPAPEDEGKTFSITNVISVGEENFATSSGDSNTVTSSGGESWTEITFNNVNSSKLNPYNYAFVEFEASTTTTATDSIKINAVYTNSNTYTIYEGQSVVGKKIAQTVPSHINGNYLIGIQFLYAHASGVYSTYSATYSGLKVRSAIPKTQFAIVSTVRLYHVGKKLFSEYQGIYTLIWSDMNEKRSSSWQIDSYIYIVDGKNFLRYASGDMEATDVTSGVGTVPLVTIARSPSGGGESYNDRNLIQPGYEERFLGTKDDLDYQLSFFPLDGTPVKVKIMQSDGTFADMTENNGFTVSRTTGIVTFEKPPGESPLTGEDNVYITAYRTAPGYADRIKKCRIGTLYGVNGETDRLFLSGNPSMPNYDWYSEISDPTYFADVSYSALGSETSAIVGYSRIGNYLATHKDEHELSQSVFVRVGEYKEETIEGSYTTSSAAFKITNTLQGAGAICSHSFGYLQTEPLFLTREGIFAITSQDVTGEKYGQNRSFYINGKLLEEADLDNAYAVNFNNYYILAVNNKLYLLDGLQPVATDKSLPYATRQYVAFYCDNIPAYTMWVDNEELFFGTSKGLVFRFFTDESALESYNDNGESISAWWETPELDGKLFYKNKTFRYLAVRLMSSLATSVTLYGKKHGIWSLLKTDNTSARYFAFSKIVFSKFSFSVDTSEKLAHTKVRIKKVDKARFKLENSILNEPFGIFDFALEYIESGNYKG